MIVQQVGIEDEWINECYMSVCFFLLFFIYYIFWTVWWETVISLWILFWQSLFPMCINTCMWKAFLYFYFFSYLYGKFKFTSIQNQPQIIWRWTGVLLLLWCWYKRGEGSEGGGSPIAEWPLLLERSNDKTLKVKEGTQRPGRESPL